jgi:hypothetical protein
VKSAHNLKKMNKKPVKRQDEHASTPGMSFGTSNPDQATKIRVKVAKGLMVKH